MLIPSLRMYTHIYIYVIVVFYIHILFTHSGVQNIKKLIMFNFSRETFKKHLINNSFTGNQGLFTQHY